MASLPSISGERAVRAFQNAGWIKDRQHGSHVILIKPGHPASLSVPQHRELAPGTLRALIRRAGMSVEGFVVRGLALIRVGESNCSNWRSLQREGLEKTAQAKSKHGTNDEA